MNRPDKFPSDDEIMKIALDDPRNSKEVLIEGLKSSIDLIEKELNNIGGTFDAMHDLYPDYEDTSGIFKKANSLIMVYEVGTHKDEDE